MFYSALRGFWGRAVRWVSLPVDPPLYIKCLLSRD
jgi:hypothetical protein